MLSHEESLPTDTVVQARANLAATLVKWRDSPGESDAGQDGESRAEALEQAIDHCLLALQIVDREQTPRKWRKYN